MSIHDSWEDLPPTVTGYCSDNANMEAEDGKDSKRTLIYHQSLSLYNSDNLQTCIHGI
ncbi:hypothetical protein FPQ18DRAFT_396674 [Pyronema domesticum]|nr:hypothetical protein FPQ18DRAFT_396674 [Pyronema domesticum]